METEIHGAERFNIIPREKGQSVQYTVHSWRQGALALSDKDSFLIFDIRQMRGYAFCEGECLIHKISCVVSNRTQGRLILWVKITSKEYAVEVRKLSLHQWKYCIRETTMFPRIHARLLFYLWYATTF